jgi:hypothetical protein
MVSKSGGPDQLHLFTPLAAVVAAVSKHFTGQLRISLIQVNVKKSTRLVMWIIIITTAMTVALMIVMMKMMVTMMMMTVVLFAGHLI